MKYTKRQKEAIDDLHKLMFLIEDVYSTGLVETDERDEYVKSIYLVLDLLDSQQKEIQKLKNKNKKYYDGKLFTANQIKAIEREQNKSFIHKDKIRRKIKEIEDSLKEDCIALHEFQRLAKIDVLKELLGDE